MVAVSDCLNNFRLAASSLLSFGFSGVLRLEWEEAEAAASTSWWEIFCICISGRSKRVSCR